MSGAAFVSSRSDWGSQAKTFLMDAEDLERVPKYVMRDYDTKFTVQFDEVFKSSGVEVNRTVPLSPSLRAHVERFIQTLKVECLDKFVIVAERHLNHVNREWRLHNNRDRPHESRGHLPPGLEKAPENARRFGQATLPARRDRVGCSTPIGDGRPDLNRISQLNCLWLIAPFSVSLQSSLINAKEFRYNH